KYAYTIDSGEIGELEYESFNAANIKVSIQGKNVHPGKAKNKMKNAVSIGLEFNNLFPAGEKPEYTEEYEGYFHCNQFHGNVEKVEMVFLIRDHDRTKFENRKKFFLKAVNFINEKYGENTLAVDMKDFYYNMREKIEPVMPIVDIVKDIMIDMEIEPKISPIRGGTDGARLSFMGLPTPNIFTGGHNGHGKYEYIPVFAMEKAVDVIVKLAETYVTKKIK
ncbi:MAG: peptidase T, partial [Spirochaetes bacterium]|nr:peptidase T [Spirochaetota bacterium]